MCSDASAPAVIRGRKRTYFEMVRGTLRPLASEVKLRDVDPTVATFSLFGMINWISRWYRRDGTLAPELIVTDFTEIAMSSLLRAETDDAWRARTCLAAGEARR